MNLVEGDAVNYDEDYDEVKGKTKAINIIGGTGGEGGGKGFRGEKGFNGGKGFGGGSGYGGDGKGRGGGKSFGFGGKGKGKSKGNTIFVGGLSWDTTSDSLRSCFADAGEITYAGVMTDRDTGRSRGCGKVEFATAEGMEIAIAQWNKTELDGRTIDVRAFT